MKIGNYIFRGFSNITTNVVLHKVWTSQNLLYLYYSTKYITHTHLRDHKNIDNHNTYETIFS